MDNYSYIANAHGEYIDQLYKAYQENPQSVDESWQRFFEGFEFSIARYGENGKPLDGDDHGSQKETRVRNLIYAYRSRAHLKSDTNPVRQRRQHTTRLDLENFGLSEGDLNEEFEIFKELVPTAENLTYVIWKILREVMDDKFDLSVRLWETERNSVIYPAV